MWCVRPVCTLQEAARVSVAALEQALSPAVRAAFERVQRALAVPALPPRPQGGVQILDKLPRIRVCKETKNAR